MSGFKPPGGGRPPYLPVQQQQLQQVAVHRLAVERVAAVLLALGAHVHGEYVLHAVARGTPGETQLIQCTIAAALIPRVAATIAACGFDVMDAADDAAAASATAVRKLLVAGASIGVELCPYEQPRRRHRQLPFFDWQLLAVSNDRLYVRHHGWRPTTASSSSVHALLFRARSGVFCLTADALSADVRQHARAMCRAARMVLERDWRMDDALASRRAWLVSRWDRMRGSRLQQNPQLRSQGDDFWMMDGPRVPFAARSNDETTHDHCPICMERFQMFDVVVNLPCNHNFHAACPSSAPAGLAAPHVATGGVCAWLVAGHDTCPCCRAAISTPAPAPPPR